MIWQPNIKIFNSSSNRLFHFTLMNKMANLHLNSAMKASSILILLIAATIVSAKSKDVTELQIGVKHKPATCEVQAHKGDKIKVHYRGKLTDDTVFDSSFERGTPFEFELGSGQVIKGWDQGLLGMCVGEKRKLKILPKWATESGVHHLKSQVGPHLYSTRSLLQLMEKERLEETTTKVSYDLKKA